MTEPQPTPPIISKRFQFWTITLLILILLTVAWPTVSDLWTETRCTMNDGRIQVHNLSGRRLCDFFPYADGISDMTGDDYWID